VSASQVGNVVNDKTSFHDFMLPIFVSGAFVLVLGAASVYLTPALLERKLLPALPAAIREQAVLGLIFATALLLMPACKYAGTSELLGARPIQLASSRGLSLRRGRS
jgi:hypothetical protein